MDSNCSKCGFELCPNGTCFSFTCCKTCFEIDRMMVADAYFDAKLRQHFKTMRSHCCQAHGYSDKLSHSGNGTHSGLFAFTLTSSPSDGLSEKDLLIAVDKLMEQKTCPVKRYSWYLEFKENNTHPHIHGIYETESGGRITAKVFKRAWNIWDEKQRLGHGHRGGYHKPVTSESDYRDYISKDSGIHKSKGF